MYTTICFWQHISTRFLYMKVTCNVFVHLILTFSRATAEALAAEATQENYEKGLIYPPFTNIRKISANIAAKVAAKVYELGE